MEYKNIYQLSERFSPPKVDLRQAKIRDDYGDDRYAKLKIQHNQPGDVTREEFDYYGWVYPFMEPGDLLFYLYPMLIEYKKDPGIDCIDSFMYSMDRELTSLLPKLSAQETDALKVAFNEIWKTGNNTDLNDWYQCENIQKFIGVM